MANKSPFRCPKVLFGPFRWRKSFSVFSRTGDIPQYSGPMDTYLYNGLMLVNLHMQEISSFFHLPIVILHVPELHVFTAI